MVAFTASAAVTVNWTLFIPITFAVTVTWPLFIDESLSVHVILSSAGVVHDFYDVCVVYS